ncbi:hypothetical protein MARPO_0008s0136 [Marchantia polymorpha]|uniref:Uncharacterized protein n=1 Tax=Marchantia polymorpha TaxID=3197 RepID=A0A2R6XMN3_MARPO|nr:hypothetical protein MARPO_0008s0136 [Marchantia polymorpha]|eukprot:PTQ47371.1 hypothetical protein MARPO_0008s0136 [Marchantia polymorpha]
MKGEGDTLFTACPKPSREVPSHPFCPPPPTPPPPPPPPPPRQQQSLRPPFPLHNSTVVDHHHHHTSPSFSFALSFTSTFTLTSPSHYHLPGSPCPLLLLHCFSLSLLPQSKSPPCTPSSSSSPRAHSQHSLSSASAAPSPFLPSLPAPPGIVVGCVRGAPETSVRPATLRPKIGARASLALNLGADVEGREVRTSRSCQKLEE